MTAEIVTVADGIPGLWSVSGRSSGRIAGGHPVAESEWTPPVGSWASSDAVRRTMLGNRRRDTRPELALRSAVHRLGLRYRVARRPPGIRRSADLVFPKERVAVFMDGCYWHLCSQHFTYPTTNAAYWRRKIDGNAARDRDTDARLAAAGWSSLRVWEHEAPERAARRVAAAVRARR
jgi:DNA mismatch endonuclease, patch repair protein